MHRVEGYLLIPHELLHVAAYRLLAKPCRYVWGEPRVRALAPLSRRERLFVLLFPLAVTWGLSLGLYGLALVTLLYVILPQAPHPIENYWREVPLWHFGLIVTGWLCMLYGSTGTGDLMIAYRLLTGGTQDRTHQPHDQTAEKQGDRQTP